MEIILAVISVVGVIFGGAGFWGYLTIKKTTKTASDRLLLGLAFCEITRTAEHYLDRGYITTAEYNELDRYLFQPYKELGGDGTAEKLMGDVKKLPTDIDRD